MAKFFIYIFIVSCLISVYFCEIIRYGECGDAGPTGACNIKEIRIEPCKEALNNKTCILKKSRTYKIEMDFDASQNIEKFNACPYYGEVAFAGINTNGCEYTACPIQNGASQTYTFQLKIAKYLPRGQYDVKWKFWLPDNEAVGCCALFYLKLAQ